MSSSSSAPTNFVINSGNVAPSPSPPCSSTGSLWALLPFPFASPSDSCRITASTSTELRRPPWPMGVEYPVLLCPNQCSHCAPGTAKRPTSPTARRAAPSSPRSTTAVAPPRSSPTPRRTHPRTPRPSPTRWPRLAPRVTHGGKAVSPALLPALGLPPLLALGLCRGASPGRPPGSPLPCRAMVAPTPPTTAVSRPHPGSPGRPCRYALTAPPPPVRPRSAMARPRHVLARAQLPFVAGWGHFQVGPALKK
nr:vegetative cell wall protein gp1-like [Aegilops tauschii subsp. strangulata]